MKEKELVCHKISSVVTVGGVEVKQEDALWHLPIYLRSKQGFKKIECPLEAVQLIDNEELRQYFTDIFTLLEGEEWVYE